MSDTPKLTDSDGSISWRGMVVRLAGLAFAAFLITNGWVFWPIVIAIICLTS